MRRVKSVKNQDWPHVSSNSRFASNRRQHSITRRIHGYLYKSPTSRLITEITVTLYSVIYVNFDLIVLIRTLICPYDTTVSISLACIISIS